VLGIARTFEEAMIKAFQGAGMHLITNGNAIVTVKDQDKEEVLPIAHGLHELGWTIYSTEGTSAYLQSHGVENVCLNKVGGEKPDILDCILSGKIDLVINTPSKDRKHRRDGFLIRRNTVEAGIPCLTSLDTANAFLRCVQHVEDTNLSVVDITKVSSFLVFL
jgi:carbamoyl-phosphate synthase large subunit